MMGKLGRVLWRWARRTEWNRELDEELAAHREMKRHELAGEGDGDLGSSVRRELGNETQMKEDARAVWIAPWLESLAQDLRIGVRQLWHFRGFTLTVVIILALGIGLNAAVFTLLSNIAFRPLPFRDPEQLVYVMEQHVSGCCSPPSWLDQRDIREQQHTFESLAAYSFDPNFLVTTHDETRHVSGGSVTPDYFSTLGVRPIAGRVFTSSEAQPGRDNVVVLREDFWRSEFGGDADILRKTIRVNGVTCSVVGILPSQFRFPTEEAVIWTPLVPSTVQRTQRGWHGFPMVGRVKAAVTIDAAHADLNAIMARLSHRYSEDKNRVGAVFPFQTWGREDTRSRLLVLQFSALAIFLMTCANVSSLLLARYSTRRREFAVCAALGASRLRLIRKHLSEALLLAALGCAAGVAVAWAGVKLLLLLYQDRLPRTADVAVDWRLVLFMAGTTLGGALAFGLTTAFHENTKDLERCLRESNRASSGRRGMKLRQLLVVAQMACAVALLAGSGELIQSFWNLLRADTGLRTSNVLTMRVDIPETKYQSSAAAASFYDQAVERIRRLPNVQSAAAINMLPVAQWGTNGDVEVSGLPAHAATFFAENRSVAGDYFNTMGIPFMRGRNFVPEEMAGKRKAVIINQTMAKALWNDKDPVGYSVRGFMNSRDWFTVAGVVRDVRQAGIDQPVRSELFFPLDTSDEPWTGQYIVVHSRAGAPELAGAVRREISRLDPEAGVYKFKSMDEVIYDSIAGYRITATLLVLFAVLALLLAAFGIYGVVSYSVTERKRELAIRTALGAQPLALIQMIFQQSVVMIAAGVVLGVGGGFFISRLLANLLYGVGGGDVAALVVAVTILTSIAAAASLVPALRASRVDPMLPLRQE